MALTLSFLGLLGTLATLVSVFYLDRNGRRLDKAQWHDRMRDEAERHELSVRAVLEPEAIMPAEYGGARCIHLHNRGEHMAIVRRWRLSATGVSREAEQELSTVIDPGEYLELSANPVVGLAELRVEWTDGRPVRRTESWHINLPSRPRPEDPGPTR